MSFVENHEIVQNGDTVILFLGHNSMQTVKMVSGKVHQTKFGAFPHDRIIGKRFGSKVFSKNNRGYVYLLYPSPELWTVTLPHRTQILYTTDISLITLELDLKPGSVVVESGTGSGSISHAFVRTIMPTGHLHTFDFHQQRADQAKLDFESHGIGKFVTGACKDVLADGFGLKNVADAVFLDLPKPWVAIPHAKEALKASGGRVCSFSPCIEQVQRTCEQLRKSGFCEIKTLECLCKTYDVRTVPLPEAKFSKPKPFHGKVARDGETKIEVPEDEVETLPDEKLEETSNCNVINEDFTKAAGSLKRPHPDSTNEERNPHVKLQKPGNLNTLTARPIKEIPGHTGYLTFASLLPVFKGL
ncbi:tRNA (adenine(58)-N(1))-methyltransferase catalytic subunit TRMT61A-like [Rhopilema esculentum]|uniref:tRNA (adenine(58)-N(1))-methyltransferase catalytic subunit TRMT61A-like n=1 Tax=Rhopilema esculentum TaxID=499914 RepID=UPI0031DF4BDD